MEGGGFSRRGQGITPLCPLEKRPTSIYINAPLKGCKELLTLKHLHGVRGFRATVSIHQPTQGGIDLWSTHRD